MGHSLNLVSSCSVEGCSDLVTLLNVIQIIYFVFVASTYRWRKLCEVLQNTEKKLTVSKTMSTTRWSARADAVKALNERHNRNITVLMELSADNNQPA